MRTGDAAHITNIKYVQYKLTVIIIINQATVVKYLESEHFFSYLKLRVNKQQK